MRRLLALAFALPALLAAPPASAETLTAGGGELRAQVETDPWRISFVDGSGRMVLEEAAGARLGFRTPTGWAGALRATAARRDGEAIVAEVETASGGRLDVRIAPDAAGVVAVEAKATPPFAAAAVGIGFTTRDGERHLGFGQRSTGVDQRGRTVETYVADGPYQPGAERRGISVFVPGPGFRDRDDATYFPIPWLLSTAGYGVLVDNTETTYHRLGTDDPGRWSLEVTSAPDGMGSQEAPARLAFRVFAGPSPADVLRRFTERTGRQPRPDAPWVFGPWYQPARQLDQMTEQVQRLRDARAPLSVVQTYLHYLPCGDQQGVRDEERRKVQAMHDLGLAITTYFNPMICDSYNPPFDEAVAASALTERADGSPYVYRYSSSPTNHFQVGQFDFSGEAGRSFYQRLLAEAVEDGHDGWMEDFGEYTPLDSRSDNGMAGTEMHNLYPVQYHCTAHEFVKRQGRPVIRFQRSGFTGVAPCAQVVWSGDPTTGWGFDGLASQVTAALSIGLSGISTWGSDIGGFFAIGENRTTPELLKRWVQFGAVSPVMRTQRNGVALPSKSRPQVDDREQIGNWRRWARFHNQLYPYLVAADAEYARSGLPIMRHHALTHPGDAEAAGREDQFMFGPDILAAPVVTEGATERRVWLPWGRWIDLWRAVGYADEGGELTLGRAAAVSGGREVTLPAPLEELPLLVRAGTLLPLLSPDVETLAGYGPKSVVKLSDRADRLRVLAFPRGRSHAAFMKGEALASRERGHGWVLTVRGKRVRRYALQASLATLRRQWRPCTVRLRGRRVARRRWSFDRGTRVFRISFRARRARLVVRRCG